MAIAAATAAVAASVASRRLADPCIAAGATALPAVPCSGAFAAAGPCNGRTGWIRLDLGPVGAAFDAAAVAAL